MKVNVILITFLFLFNNQGIRANERVADKLMTQLDQLIQGEFDNYNQVNFQSNDYLNEADIPLKKHARLYKRATRINAPVLGEYVYYHQVHDGGKDKPIYRQSVQVFSINYQGNTLIAQNYTFKTPKAFENLWLDKGNLSLSLDDLSIVGEHCHSEYRSMGQIFIGGIDKKKCKIKSKKFGYLNLSTQQVYSENSFWHLEEGFLPSGKMLFGREDDIPHKLTRAKNFECWAAFKTQKVQDNGEPHWDFFSKLIIHNQGDVAKFSTTDKEPNYYFIRLKETVFPAGKRPDVIEMFIHENTENKENTEKSKQVNSKDITQTTPLLVAKETNTQALAYTWANADATRLGINLRWMQASCNSRF